MIHQTPASITTLTVTPNGMYKVTHKSPCAFKYSIKRCYMEQLTMYNKMVNYSLGINPNN